MTPTAPLRRRIFLGGFTIQGLVPAASAHAQGAQTPTPTQRGRAPFGLTWGMSAAHLHNLGAELGLGPLLRDGYEGQVVSVTGLPRALHDTKSITLYFGLRDRLFRVVAEGEPQRGDPFAGAAVARYRELFAILSENYGRGSETAAERGPLRQGIIHRSSTFQNEDVDVSLRLYASSSDTASWLLVFVHRGGADGYEADRRKRDREAL
jgi:hypothetical protein